MWWEEERDNWSHEQGKEGEALGGQGNGNRIQEGPELVIVVVAIMMRMMFMFQPMPMLMMIVMFQMFCMPEIRQIATM